MRFELSRGSLIHRPVVVLDVRGSFIHRGGKTLPKTFSCKNMDRRYDRPSRSIGISDTPVPVDADDSVRRRLQHLVQLFRNPVALTLCNPPLIDIAKDKNDAGEFAFLIANRSSAVVDVCLSTVFGPENGVISQANHGTQTLNFFDRTFHRLPCVFTDNAKYSRQGLTYGFVKGAPSQSLRNRIHVRDGAFGVGHNDGVADALQDAPRARLALLQLSVCDHLSGHVLQRAEKAGNPVPFIDRIKGVIQVEIPYSAFGREGHEQLFVEECLAGGEGFLEQRADNVPGFSVDIPSRLSQGCRVARSWNWPIGVVVDQNEIGAPHGSRRRGRTQCQIYDRQQFYRPGIDGAKRGGTPVVRANKIRHLPGTDDAAG